MDYLIQAIINIVKRPSYDIVSLNSGINRANNQGDALESFVKDAICNSFEFNTAQKQDAYSQLFSYLGNQNNPPDMIVRHSDAIEIKKVINRRSAIALNSSFPKNKLSRNSPMITQHCRNCEENWQEKPLLYIVGEVSKNQLRSLQFVYGELFAADASVYERIKNTIADGVRQIANVEFAPTKELGRVNRVDPLGITYLRIRGMWHICNPNGLFSDLYPNSVSANFQLYAIIPEYKYKKMNPKLIDEFELLANKINTEQTTAKLVNTNPMETLKLDECQVANPNNPAQLIDCKLIYYCC